MDGRGRWMDNVFIERLWKSVKYERIYLFEHSTLKAPRASLLKWFDRYNDWRPHAELGNQHKTNFRVSALATVAISGLTPLLFIFPAVKAHEIYSAVDPAIVTQILDWFRANDKNVYKSAVATLAGNRKLRPVFIQKKSLADQYAWVHKTLKLNACETIGEHLLQAYLMAGQQSLLAMFCDGLGIPHDGKGSVVGELPKKLDATRLAETIDRLIGLFDPKLLTVYLHCFNLQTPNGWPELTEKLNSDERLVLRDKVEN